MTFKSTESHKNSKKGHRCDYNLALYEKVFPTFYKCEYCPEQETVLPELYKHIKRKHGNEKWLNYRTKVIPNVQEYRCSMCTFVFETEQKSAESEHECDVYRIVLQSVRKMQSPRKTAKVHPQKIAQTAPPDVPKNLLKCPVCPQHFEYLKLNEHIKEEHEKEKWVDFRTNIIPNVQEYACEACGFLFAKEERHNCILYKKLISESPLAQQNLKTRGFKNEQALINCPCCVEKWSDIEGMLFFQFFF